MFTFFLFSMKTLDFYVTFLFSFQFCWGHQSYLAEIKSKEEEDHLDQYLITGVTYWIGLTDFPNEGLFIYLC